MHFSLFIHLAGRACYSDHEDRRAFHSLDERRDICAPSWDDAKEQARILLCASYRFTVLGGNLSERDAVSPLRVVSFTTEAGRNAARIYRGGPRHE